MQDNEKELTVVLPKALIAQLEEYAKKHHLVSIDDSINSLVGAGLSYVGRLDAYRPR